MKRNDSGSLLFDDFPAFTPNLSPREMFEQGCFGGTYWRPIHSRVLGMMLADQHLEFEELFHEIDEELLVGTEFNREINRYRAKCGTTLELWDSKGWIHALDPYGWVQWYCRFFSGRRCEDDQRQVKRWCNIAGPKGRFRRQLISRIIQNDSTFNDESVSPVIRQGLHQWGYVLTESDFEKDRLERWKRFHQVE